jgi:hypothetical protein
VPDDAFLAEWCDRYLGARPARVLFRSGNLSEVTGAELADGRRVVIKARPSDPRIAGCTAVQKHLARAGFPCPEPLSAPVEVGGLWVRLFNAKKDAADGDGPQLDCLAGEIGDRPAAGRLTVSRWLRPPPTPHPPQASRGIDHLAEQIKRDQFHAGIALAGA